MSALFRQEMIGYVVRGISAPITPENAYAMWRRCNDKVPSASRHLLLAQAVEYVTKRDSSLGARTDAKIKTTIATKAPPYPHVG